MNYRSESGFTLFELLVVVAIIGIILSIATASYSLAQKKSRDSKRKLHLDAVRQAFEQYYQDNKGVYVAGCSVGTSYLPGGMPKDPKTDVEYTAAYGSNCTAASYCLCAALEAEVNTQTDCSGTSPPTGYSGFYCIRSLQ